MDKLKDLISFFLKVAFALFLAVVLLWLITLVPMFYTSQKTSSPQKRSFVLADILPSPRTYSGFFATKETAGSGQEYTNGKVYVPHAPYNGYASGTGGGVQGVYGGGRYGGYSYSTYTYSSYQNISSETNVQGSESTASTSGNGVINTVVRNLSIYKGGHIYTGLAFVGEAKSSLFRDGKFPIIVVDATGKVIGVSMAIAQTTWSVPGWVRFETKIIYNLPNNVPCTMIFEEALTQTERIRQPQRSSIPVRCN